MKVIIAGSRTVDGPQGMAEVNQAIDDSGWADQITLVISGTARGVDQLGEQWARAHNIPVERHPADWNTWGRSGGYRRNVEMSLVADGLVAIRQGESRGTSHMVDIMRRAGKPVHVRELPREPCI